MLEFRNRLTHYKVLDPACGSGNFLYLALLGLKDLEHRVLVESESMGVASGHPEVDPSVVHGIEINRYAAELARVTIWIGQIQWMRKHGFALSKDPILKPLDQIECRDALLDPDWKEAGWPKADAIVGNPPFLGDKKMYEVLGKEYTYKLRNAFAGRLDGRADLVTYWFEKARAAVESGATSRVGLVSTNSIRQKSNRKALERIKNTGSIFKAWSDLSWVIDGAAVRVSIVCFSANNGQKRTAILDEEEVEEIFSDLTGGKVGRVRVGDLTRAKPCRENLGLAFQGIKRVGNFLVTGDVARSWILDSPNPNGRSNSDVLRPWVNGIGITKRMEDLWIVDFGVNTTENEAAQYERPFEYIRREVKPTRKGKREARANEMWWIYYWPRPEMREAINRLQRYIAVPSVSKHRLFVWLHKQIMPEGAIVVIARDDDTCFGILHSRMHESWSLRAGSWIGVGNDPTYTPTTTFETFPFPEGLTPDIPAAEYAEDARARAIGSAARALDQQRNAWLNPPEWVRREPEVVPGYPERLIPVDEDAAKQLKERTLTKLYNARPQWLVNAHAALDAAVAAAYGWPADLGEDEVLARLLALNLERAAQQG